MRLPVPPLLVISDRHQARQPLEEVAEAVFRGGCRWFSLREKDLPPEERRALLAALVALGHRFGAAVTAHEDIEAVAAAAPDGVHLASGGSPEAARARLPDALIGASAHSADEAVALLRAGADYVTASPVFLTPSKPGYGPAIGQKGLAEIARAASVPVLAIGGLNATRAAELLAALPVGIAVMGNVMRAADPGREVKALLSALVGAAHRKSAVL